MPVANAVTCLPRLGHNLIWSTSLHIPCQSLALLLVENLTKHYGTRVLVVEMRCNLQSAVTDFVEWGYIDIEVYEVGLITVDGIEGAVVEIGDVFL